MLPRAELLRLRRTTPPPRHRRRRMLGPSDSTLERITESHRYENECCSAYSKQKHADTVHNLMATKPVALKLEQALLAVNRFHFMHNTGVQLKSEYYTEETDVLDRGSSHVCFGATRELDSLHNYARILDMLQLQPGQSFLHLGSGTGYLNTVVGCIIGATGVNHGVEKSKDMLAYAEERQEAFKDHTPVLQDFEYCEPSFALGDCLKLSLETRYYDRIYCSGILSEGFDFFLRIYLKPDGILLSPKTTNTFSKVTLGPYNRFITQEEGMLGELKVYPLDFKTEKSGELTPLPVKSFPSLQELTRSAIRVRLRNKYQTVNITRSFQNIQNIFPIPNLELPPGVVEVTNNGVEEMVEDPPERPSNDPPEGPSNGHYGIAARCQLFNLTRNLEHQYRYTPTIGVGRRAGRPEIVGARRQVLIENPDSEDSDVDEGQLDSRAAFEQAREQARNRLSIRVDFLGSFLQPPIFDEVVINDTMVSHAVLMRSICRKCHMLKNDCEVRQPSPLNPDAPDQPNSLNALISTLPLPKQVLSYLKYKNSAIIHH